MFFGRLSLGTFERIWKMIGFKKLKNFLSNEHSAATNKVIDTQESVKSTETKTTNLKKSNSIINSVGLLFLYKFETKLF